MHEIVLSNCFFVLVVFCFEKNIVLGLSWDVFSWFKFVELLIKISSLIIKIDCGIILFWKDLLCNQFLVLRKSGYSKYLVIDWMTRPLAISNLTLYSFVLN